MKKLISAVVNFTFPSFECISCAGEIFESKIPHICDNCESTMTRHVPGIINADAASPKDEKPYFNKVYVAYRYNTVVKTVIMRLKYSNDGLAAVALGGGMRDILGLKDEKMVNGKNLSDKYDIILPVPLSKRRGRERGYNQAELLARELLPASAGQMGKYGKTVPIIRNDIVQRTKNTKPQVDMTTAQRRENQAGAFTVASKSAISGRRILIVDDVMTSGATVNELARTLRQAGAEHIDVIVAAKI